MSGVKILISPLSWGYGHAGRMIPLALELKRKGCEVIFAADAALLRMAGKDLPGVTLEEIPGLRISYSRFLPQYLCIFLQLPRIIVSAIRDHATLRRLAEKVGPAVIISDNRFGFYHSEIFSVYVTHQVRIPFPAALRFMEPLAALVHRIIIRRYDLCLVPDYPGDENLSGRLSHRSGSPYPGNLVFTGPLSRFAPPVTAEAETLFSSIAAAEDPALQLGQADGHALDYAVPDDLPRYSAPTDNPELQSVQADDSSIQSSPYVCLLLSGPEPQRSLLLAKVVAALGAGKSDLMPAKSPEDPQADPGTGVGSPPEPPPAINLTVLTATPLNRLPQSRIEIKYFTSPSTPDMHRIITGASIVIARAGYSSIMELASIGRGAVLIPTPGQPEQEYLGKYLDGRYGFVTLRQNNLERLAILVEDYIRQAGRHGDDTGSLKHFPDAAALLEKGLDHLLENNKK